MMRGAPEAAALTSDLARIRETPGQQLPKALNVVSLAADDAPLIIRQVAVPLRLGLEPRGTHEEPDISVGALLGVPDLMHHKPADIACLKVRWDLYTFGIAYRHIEVKEGYVVSLLRGKEFVEGLGRCLHMGHAVPMPAERGPEGTDDEGIIIQP